MFLNFFVVRKGRDHFPPISINLTSTHVFNKKKNQNKKELVYNIIEHNVERERGVQNIFSFH